MMSPNLFIRNSWRLNLLFLIKLLYIHLSSRSFFKIKIIKMIDLCIIYIYIYICIDSDKSDILNSMKSICEMSQIDSDFCTLPSTCECSSVALFATNMLGK